MENFTKQVLISYLKPFILSLFILLILFIGKFINQPAFNRVATELAFFNKVEFIYLNLPWMITLIIPMSVFFAAFFGFRRLHLNGLLHKHNLMQSTVLILSISLLLSIFLYYFYDIVLKDFNYRAHNYYRYLKLSKAELEREEKASSFNRDRREMSSKMIKAKIAHHENRILEELEKSENLLKQHFTNQLNIDRFIRTLKDPNETENNNVELNILLDSLSSESKDNLLIKLKNSKKVISYFQRNIGLFELEAQRRFALSLNCFVFAFLGILLGLIFAQKRLMITILIILSILFIYWFLTIVGDFFADRNLYSPILFIWLPNIVMSFLGVLLSLYMVFRKGSLQS